jgi:hypothetical protein
MVVMVVMLAATAAWGTVAADLVSTLRQIAGVSQTVAAIVAGLLALLGVPLALRQVVNLQRELRRYEVETRRKLDAEANLNITADYTLTHATHVAPHDSVHGRPIPATRERDISSPPSPAAEPGKRVLRLDLTLENVGEGSVDVLACLVAARELERQGDEVIAGGRDAQWEDLTAHYWDGDDHCLSPGLSTTKHIVYAQDALARIKAHSRKTLARIDQIREREPDEEIYLLYRAFVAARRSSRSVEAVQAWAELQRALLNLNAPAFRVATGERDALGYVASADGWRLFLLHYRSLADAKLSALRSAADREELAVRDPEERRRLAARHAEELQAYCMKTLVPRWKAFQAEHARMTANPAGFLGLMRQREFRARQRETERRFPWSSQEVWTEYFYVTVHEDE